jgi:L-ascorbate 6-phosphate lactonase
MVFILRLRLKRVRSCEGEPEVHVALRIDMADWVVPETRTQPVNRGVALRTEMESSIESRIAAWWLTQASWMVRFQNGPLVLIDPWWRDLFAGDRWGKLLGEFPLEPEEHPEPDLILCTHWHDDHICPESIPRLAVHFPSVKFVVPNRSVNILTGWGISEERIIPMMGSDSITIDQLQIHAIPAAHEELDITEEGAWYLGYVLNFDNSIVLHMGDSRPYPGWHSAFQNAEDHYDLVFACINGNDNLRHDEAVDLAMVLQPKMIVPMHYGMDPGNTVDPQIFTDEISSRAPNQPFVIPDVGGKILID